jgi:hypothetical protein
MFYMERLIIHVPYNIFCMKEEDYVMKIMPTYGSNCPPMRERMRARRTKADGAKVEFEYIEPIANHSDYQHCVDDNNHLRICGRRLKKHGEPIDGFSDYLVSFLLCLKLIHSYACDTLFGEKVMLYISMHLEEHYQ